MTKISELRVSAPASALTGAEAFHLVEDPAGTPVSKAGLISQIRTYIRAQLGIANGFASLNASGQVPASQLPGGDSVLTYANLAAFPGTGEVGYIYVALDTDLSYLWDDDTSSYILQGSASTSSTLLSMPAVGFKEPCRRVATSNVNIATGGIVSIDGGNTVNGDRILLTGQTAPAENGIYVCNSTGAWSRAADANTVAKVRAAVVTVWQGTTYGGSVWATTFKQGNTLGTTAMNWFKMLTTNDSTSVPWEMLLAVSDETTALTTGTAKVTFRMPRAVTLSSVRASVTTAPTGSTLVVDINEGGASILSTKLSIDASEKTSTTAASAAVISDASLADDAEITIDIDQVGSTIAGAGLKVLLKGTIA